MAGAKGTVMKKDVNRVGINYEKLTELCKKTGISQTQVGLAIGKKKSYIGMAKATNMTLPIEWEAKMCKELGVPAGTLALEQAMLKIDLAKLNAKLSEYGMTERTLAMVIGKPELKITETMTADTEKEICKVFHLKSGSFKYEPPKATAVATQPKPTATIDKEIKDAVMNTANEVQKMKGHLQNIFARMPQKEKEREKQITDTYLEVATLVEQTINKKLDGIEYLIAFAKREMDAQNKARLGEFVEKHKGRRISYDEIQSVLPDADPQSIKTAIRANNGIEVVQTGFSKAIPMYEFK